MRWMIIFAVLAASVLPARAQEFYFLGGGVAHTETHDISSSWQLEYLEGLGEHFAASISYLNEGHLPQHHRDGDSLQVWGRSNLFDRRLSLAVGAGPYYFFDTAQASGGGAFTNDHGLGGLFSFAATWYADSRWLFQLRTNWVNIGGHFDTLSAVAGIGYQLESPSLPGPLPTTPPQQENTTNNEITLFLGRTIANSFDSEHATAMSIEYRRGIRRYLDWTVAYLFEGDNSLSRRNGLTTQLWAVREFLDDRLALGVGGGAYFAVNHYNESRNNESDDGFLAAILTLTASYRFHPHWQMRTSWNRVITGNDSDSDVILGGIGYRF